MSTDDRKDVKFRAPVDDAAESGEPSSAHEVPASADLPSVRFCEPPHPAVLPEAKLLLQCRFTQHRRGGPGGQHRNKVSTAITVLHEPSSISAEASERRDQVQNRRQAILRLRIRLAISVRSSPAPQIQIGDQMRPAMPLDPLPETIRERYRDTPLKLALSNADRPAVLALLLDDLYWAGGVPAGVARQWAVSASAIVQFLALQPAALQLVNRWRSELGRHPLKSS